MALAQNYLPQINDNLESKSVMHINRLNYDLRKCNLVYINETNNTIKNLPPDFIISDSEMTYLSKYVSYIKPYGTHCDRFVVTVGDTKWKTTSSCKVSLRYKFEEAKKYLRELRHHHPRTFRRYNINGIFL